MKQSAYKNEVLLFDPNLTPWLASNRIALVCVRKRKTDMYSGRHREDHVGLETISRSKALKIP